MLEILTAGSSTKPSQTSSSSSQSSQETSQSPQETGSADNQQSVEEVEENGPDEAEAYNDGTYDGTPSVTEPEPQQTERQQDNFETSAAVEAEDKDTSSQKEENWTPPSASPSVGSRTGSSDSSSQTTIPVAQGEIPAQSAGELPNFVSRFRERFDEITSRYKSTVEKETASAVGQGVQHEQSLAIILHRLSASVESPALTSLAVQSAKDTAPDSLAVQWYRSH